MRKDSVSTCLENLSVENFWCRSDLRKMSVFHEFPLPFAKRIRRPAADSILIPLTFSIASLNRYTPKFSGVPQKLTGCQQITSRSSQSELMPIFCRRKTLFLGIFQLNKFPQPNGQLLPISCHTYLESLCISG